MGETLEKIFAVLLAVILMFFFPLLDAFERIDDLSFMTVYAATVKFVDAVRTTGHITPAMYTEFNQKLNSTGNRYTINMTHTKSMYYPEQDYIGNGATKPKLTEGHGCIKLSEEFNTEQILYSMGFLKYEGDELVSKVPDEDAEYDNFSLGDYFYVTVQNSSATPATVIKRVLYGKNVSEVNIMVPYGGLVENIQERKIDIDKPAYTITPATPIIEEPTPVEPPVVSNLIADNVHIGDYVDYGEHLPNRIYATYGLETYYTGWTSQSIVSYDDLKWRVLSKDGDEVTLIGEVHTGNNITLYGQNGYLRGPEKIDSAYSWIYSTELSREARNINVTDVNKVMGYTTSVGVEGYYTYSGSDYKPVTSEEYRMIFGDSGNYSYWLSSSCMREVAYAGYTDFIVFLVKDGYVIGTILYDSSGSGSSDYRKCYTRPVVILNPSVKVDGGDGSSSNPWKINM